MILCSCQLLTVISKKRGVSIVLLSKGYCVVMNIISCKRGSQSPLLQARIKYPLKCQTVDHNDPSKPSHRLTNGPKPSKTIESDGSNIKNLRKTIDGNGQTTQKTFNGDGLLKKTLKICNGLFKTIEIYSTDFFFYPPITAKLYFDILFDIPELSEQTLPHQWRLLYN